MSNVYSPKIVIALFKALLIGLATKLPAGVTQFSLNGKLMPVADIVLLVQEYLGIYEAVPTNHGLWRNALAVREGKTSEVSEFISAIGAALKTVVGKNNQDLTAFGFKTPKERTEPTADQVAERVKKGLATRAARHTMGKRQKSKIHGEVTEPDNGTQPNPTPKA